MKRIYYDEFCKSPIVGVDTWLLEWAKKVPIQIKFKGGKLRIMFNSLKVFKTMEIDGVDLEYEHYCPRCLRDYGEKIKMAFNFYIFPLRETHRCPNCHFEA